MRYPTFDPTLSGRAILQPSESAYDVGVEVSARKAETGEDIIEFHIGQPDFKTPENICEAAKKAMDDGCHGYTAALGIPKARAAIAKYFTETRHIDVRPENISIENGAKIYIGHMIFAVTRHGGGEVIYSNPGYPIYEERTKSLGAIPRPINLYEKNAFNFDIDEIGRTVNGESRLLIINSPGNPSGAVMSPYELKAVAKIVRKCPKLYVLSDEMYSRFSHDRDFTSIASMPGMQERTVIMDGLSKTYSMTGWRCGFAVGNPRIIESFKTQTTNISGCANHMTQYALIEALSGPQDEAIRRVAIFKERRNLIVNLLNEIPGVTCLLPGGAFYVYPNITEACQIVGAKDSEEFRKKLLREARVSVTSDIHFGSKVPNDGEHIRFSYATSDKNIKEGVRRMRSLVESHLK